MRVASNKNHPDYPHHDPDLIQNGLVFLNGEMLEKCIFADECRGEAWAFSFRNGKYCINDNELKVNILLGEVEIIDYRRLGKICNG